MQMPSVQISYFPLRGGLNLVTPPLSMPDGMCMEALNFEVDIDGGYRRIAGYERFDGQAQPSSAVYRIVRCTFIDTVSVGDTITGETSGATGYVIAVTDSYIAFTKSFGLFIEAENIQVAAVTKAVSTSAAALGGAETARLNAEYLHAAANVYRADILPITGSGSILGVHRYNNNTYGFRNNLGGTAADMYVSSGAGWVKIDLGYQVEFTNANVNVLDLDTLTQGGVTATINRVVLETGSLLSGVNTGRLILTLPAGGNFAAGAASTSSGGTITLSGAEAAITLAPNGRYECINHNFGGLATGIKMYGASGVHEAFEFDGTVYVPLRTGMVIDTPKHIIAHVNYLMLSFDGSTQHSAVGNPYSYTVINGAGELAMGDTIRGFLSLVGSNATSALAVFTTNKTAILYGTGADNWQLVTYSFESGAFDYTMQSIGQGYALDTLGIRQLAASQDFGNFANSQVSKLIRPFIETRVTKSIGSCIVRLRNQYRLFFNDNYALHVTFDNGQVLGIMPVKFAHSFNCVASFETNSGEEYVLAGGTDGYVYRMEKGTSFDGESIEHYVNLSFSYMKNPRSRKRFRKALYELSGNNYTEFETGYQLGYASNEINQGVNAENSKNGAQVFWDEFVWDNFYWDGKSISPSEQDLTGTAENISLILRGDSAVFRPFTINSAIIHYTVRRMQR
jgi:hypothetical protein